MKSKNQSGGFAIYYINSDSDTVPAQDSASVNNSDSDSHCFKSILVKKKLLSAVSFASFLFRKGHKSCKERSDCRLFDPKRKEDI